MYTVYILQSETTYRYYVGQTEDITQRLKQHNNDNVTSTKKRGPWKLVRSEIYDTRKAACQRELEIKSYKGGIKFKRLLGLWKD